MSRDTRNTLRGGILIITLLNSLLLTMNGEYAAAAILWVGGMWLLFKDDKFFQ